MYSDLFVLSSSGDITFGSVMICVLMATALGYINASIYNATSKSTKSFIITLATIPLIVTIIIMLVNGNIGAGVAVAGAFSLVRFRSVPGTAKEIGAIFLAMAIGLAIGMQYISIAIIVTVTVNLIIVIMEHLISEDISELNKTLIVMIPESLDYAGVFDDLFEKYTSEHAMDKVKTTNMGSLIKLNYEITLKPDIIEQEFINELRCRNGNLEIVIARRSMIGGEL